MTSLFFWLLILYAPLGVLQLLLRSRKPGQLVLYQRIIIAIFFIAAEVLAAAYASTLFFDLIRSNGLRCATGVVGLWLLAFGAIGFGFTLLSRSTVKPISS